MAGRVQFLYDSGPLSALINVHARSLDGTARMFRANIFVPGSNNLVPGFNEHQVALDGANDQDLDSIGGSLSISYDFDRVTLHSITGYESVGRAVPRRHRRRLRRRVRAAERPGLHPLPRGVGGRAAVARADLAGVPSRIARVGQVRLAGRPLLLRRSLATSTASTTTPWAAAWQNGDVRQQQDNQAWAVFGSVRLRAQRRVHAGRGPALHG